MLSIYILERQDRDWLECYSQVVVAESGSQALSLARKEEGDWYITEIIAVDKPLVVYKEFYNG